MVRIIYVQPFREPIYQAQETLSSDVILPGFGGSFGTLSEVAAAAAEAELCSLPSGDCRRRRLRFSLEATPPPPTTLPALPALLLRLPPV